MKKIGFIITEGIKVLAFLYVFFVLPWLGFSLGVALLTATASFLIYKYRQPLMDNFGTLILMTLLSGFVILASLYEKTYSDIGDPMGYALREDPVWWLLGFGAFVLIAGLLGDWGAPNDKPYDRF